MLNDIYFSNVLAITYRYGRISFFKPYFDFYVVLIKDLLSKIYNVTFIEKAKTVALQCGWKAIIFDNVFYRFNSYFFTRFTTDWAL